MDEKTLEKLASVGITVECHSPLEISDDIHEAWASGYFAEVIIREALDGAFDDDDISP